MCGKYCKTKCKKTCMTDLDDLKHRTEWAKLDHAVIAASVHQWRRCLSGWVKAGDGHFEHCFWFRHCVFSDNYDLSYCRWSVEQTKQNQTIKPNRPSYLLYTYIMLTIDVDGIWFVDRLWRFEGKDKCETGSSIQRPRPPSWKIDMMSYFRSSWPRMTCQ